MPPMRGGWCSSQLDKDARRMSTRPAPAPSSSAAWGGGRRGGDLPVGSCSCTQATYNTRPAPGRHPSGRLGWRCQWKPLQARWWRHRTRWPTAALAQAVG